MILFTADLHIKLGAKNVPVDWALNRYYKFIEDVTNIPALQPELRDQSQYYTSLVNTGVITPNEARVKLGFEPMQGHDELRVPANIAGSAVDSSEGGRPVEDNEGDN